MGIKREREKTVNERIVLESEYYKGYVRIRNGKAISVSIYSKGGRENKLISIEAAYTKNGIHEKLSEIRDMIESLMLEVGDDSEI